MARFLDPRLQRRTGMILEKGNFGIIMHNNINSRLLSLLLFILLPFSIGGCSSSSSSWPGMGLCYGIVQARI